ncbi:hypothetical protein C8J57DRAFT_1560529 [Mycena rebaudengoi]|nr:hypothetical protein C8J57DRAFT_1560529 [Mycena rebaudengoi]
MNFFHIEPNDLYSTSKSSDRMNLMHLARITDRVPIIPRFRPVHEGLGIPVLEWSQVKDLDSQSVEDLGCWDIQNKDWKTEPIYLEAPVDLKLDISYTRAPDWVRFPTDGTHPRTMLWPVASLAMFNQRITGPHGLPPSEFSPLHQVSLPPDEHLFCCNSLYFNPDVGILENEEDLSPVWHSVGQYMHWTSELQDIGSSYIRQALGIQSYEPIPPYIAVHARRGDFEIWCNMAAMPVDLCFAPLSAYVKHVENVRAEVLEREGIRVAHVIITSDEQDEEWWKPVFALGWLRPNHTDTVELYGPWYPTLLDSVILSRARGFVGTEISTVSILARRRVSLSGGVTEMVKWGTPDADDG